MIVVLALTLGLLLGSAAPAAAQDAGLDADASTCAAPDPSLQGLLEQSLGDFRRLVSVETVSWLNAGAVAASFGHAVDGSVTARLSGSRGLDAAFEPGAVLGGAPLQVAGAVAAYTLGRATGRPRLSEVGGGLIRAQIVVQTLTASLKVSFRRTRPDGARFSFPSGHASMTFASATVLQRNLGWKAGMPAYGVATYVAASRIQEQRHFLSDVVFGAVLGIVAGRTVGDRGGDRRLVVTPLAGSGAGITVVWTAGP